MKEQLDHLSNIVLQNTDALLCSVLNPIEREDIERIRLTTLTFIQRLGQLGDDYTMTERFRHDLRAPLNSMVGFAELLLFQEQHHFTDQQRAYLLTIQQSALSITHLLDELVT